MFGLFKKKKVNLFEDSEREFLKNNTASDDQLYKLTTYHSSITGNEIEVYAREKIVMGTNIAIWYKNHLFSECGKTEIEKYEII